MCTGQTEEDKTPIQRGKGSVISGCQASLCNFEDICLQEVNINEEPIFMMLIIYTILCIDW